MHVQSCNIVADLKNKEHIVISKIKRIDNKFNKFDFSCDKCEFKTKNKYTLKMHMQSCHKDAILEKKKQFITKKRKTIDNTPKSGKKSKVNC